MAAEQTAKDAEEGYPDAGSDGEDEPTTTTTKKSSRRRKKKPAKVEEPPVAIAELGPGQEVLIQNLTGAVELNGQAGRCEDFNDEKGRWNVRLRSGEVKALKPDNLSIVQAAAPTKASKGKSKAMSNAEFDAWVAKTLRELPSAAEQMSAAERMEMDPEFSGYEFTGSLRPSHVTPQMEPPKNCELPDYACHPEGESGLEAAHIRRRQDAPIVEGQELATMREACRLGREVLDIASRFTKAGVTGDEIDRVVWQACVDRKVYPSPLNYFGFPKSVCVSVNEVICHGIPDCRPLAEGDIVNLDISIYHKGFHADLNEMLFIGQCDEASHNLVRTAYNALKTAQEMIRPGGFYRSFGDTIHTVAVKGGCSVVPAYCGHGVGRLFHGAPDVPHYRKNKAIGVMKPGHVFTIEPMLNIGGNGGDTSWPDDWTAVTRDGKRSAQFEHTFLVTETGCELLTARPGTNCTAMPPYNAADFQR